MCFNNIIMMCVWYFHLRLLCGEHSLCPVLFFSGLLVSLMSVQAVSLSSFPLCLSVHLISGARVRGQMWRASSVGSLFSSVWKVTLNVTSACASSVNATPLPSGRSRGWERLRDPSGALGKGGGGAFRGGPGGARSFPFYCERGNILTPVGVKALHFMGS